MNPQRGQEGGSAFVYPITVGPDAIDELDHVNNAVYLTWVQQAITAYWVAHAPAEEVAKIAWIALRHDIRYRSEAFLLAGFFCQELLGEALLGDQLEAKVLLRGFRGSRSQFEIQFSRGSVSVAEVDTTLCCIARATRQLHRITHELARHFAIVA